MTETEWLAATDLQPMLDFVQGKLSNRKARLFSCGCCHRVWNLLDDARSRQAVEVAEQHADGEVDRNALGVARGGAEKAHHEKQTKLNALKKPTLWEEFRFNAAVEAAFAVVSTCRSLDCRSTARLAAGAVGASKCAESDGPYDPHMNAELCFLCSLARCVFGNPFRPVSFDHGWRTPTVSVLARQMYDSRDFSLMPILADALADAGCEDAQLLGHLRGPGTHARGCWGLDLILGKS